MAESLLGADVLAQAAAAMPHAAVLLIIAADGRTQVWHANMVTVDSCAAALHQTADSMMADAGGGD